MIGEWDFEAKTTHPQYNYEEFRCLTETVCKAAPVLAKVGASHRRGC